MRHRILPASIAAATVMVLGTLMSGLLVSAHTTTGAVNAFHCIVTHGGQTAVEAGSPVVIRLAWGTQVLGDQLTFQDAQTTIVSWNDGPMIDMSDDWSSSVRSENGWTSSVEVDTGVTLVPVGAQMRFTFTLLFDRSVPEQFNPGGGGEPTPIKHSKGLSFGGTCTVIAE